MRTFSENKSTMRWAPRHLIRSYGKCGRLFNYLLNHCILVSHVMICYTQWQELYCADTILCSTVQYSVLLYWYQTALWFVLYTLYSTLYIYTLSTLSLSLPYLESTLITLSTLLPSFTLLFSTRLYSLLSTVYFILYTLYSTPLYSSPLYSTLLTSTLLYQRYCTVLYRILPYHTCTAVCICQLYMWSTQWPTLAEHTMCSLDSGSCWAAVRIQAFGFAPPAFEQRGLVIWMRKKRTTNPDASASLLLYFFWRVSSSHQQRRRFHFSGPFDPITWDRISPIAMQRF